MFKKESDFTGVYIPADLYLSRDLTWHQKICLLQINFLDNEESCYASNKYLSEQVGVSPGTITNTIRILEENEYIRVENPLGGAENTRRISILTMTPVSLRENEKAIELSSDDLPYESILYDEEIMDTDKIDLVCTELSSDDLPEEWIISDNIPEKDEGKMAEKYLDGYFYHPDDPHKNCERIEKPFKEFYKKENTKEKRIIELQKIWNSASYLPKTKYGEKNLKKKYKIYEIINQHGFDEICMAIELMSKNQKNISKKFRTKSFNNFFLNSIKKWMAGGYWDLIVNNKDNIILSDNESEILRKMKKEKKEEEQKRKQEGFTFKRNLFIEMAKNKKPNEIDKFLKQIEIPQKKIISRPISDNINTEENGDYFQNIFDELNNGKRKTISF